MTPGCLCWTMTEGCHHNLVVASAPNLAGMPNGSQQERGSCDSTGLPWDTVAGELRLPEDKLERQKYPRVCCRKELESLIGLLNHACKVVRPG